MHCRCDKRCVCHTMLDLSVNNSEELTVNKFSMNKVNVNKEILMQDSWATTVLLYFILDGDI